jgi:hypothetical protein
MNYLVIVDVHGCKINPNGEIIEFIKEDTDARDGR